MSKIKFCLQCDDGTQLVHEKRDLEAKVGLQQKIVSQVSGWHCPVCGECEFDDGEGQRFSEVLEALRLQENKRKAEELRATRKKLHLRQEDAGRIFGGGKTAFSEYERGKTQPHKSTVLLFKLLDRHPDLMAEVKSLAEDRAVAA